MRRYYKHLKGDKLKETLKELWSSDHHIPFTIERISDGRLLYLNDDYDTYSFKNKNYHLSQYSRWTYGRLFGDDRVDEGTFTVKAWAPIDNLVDNPDKYFTETFQKTAQDEKG